MITCLQFLKSQRASTGMQKISAYILTYNEAEKIEAAVSSVLWADEVVVVDSFSVDRTPQIARALGARVVDVQFKGFGDLRNRAIEACNFDWIFSLDADERCTEAVRDEIVALLAGTPPHEIYMVPRRSYMMGRWIRGSGWYPNFRQPQLFRKGSIRYTLEPVHEGFEVLEGRSVGTLRSAVWQFPFRNLEEVINKMNRYSTLGAPKLAGKRVSMASAFGHGLWSFIKHYIFKLGFIDGWAGFVIAFGNFEGTFYRYAKRYEETQAWQPPVSKPIKRAANP
jgi:glycosyltransferase involved in cell wall biosynthesis